MFVAFSHQIADARIHPVAEDVDEEIKFAGDNGVVAVESHLDNRDKGAHKNFVAAIKNEILDALNEYLSGLAKNLRIFLQIGFAFSKTDTEPRIHLTDTDVENNDADDRKYQSDSYP